MVFAYNSDNVVALHIGAQEFLMSEYNTVLKIQDLLSKLSATPIPINIIKLALRTHQANHIDYPTFVHLPETLFTGQLMMNQIEAVQFVNTRPKSLLCLDMGTGKTAIGLYLIALLKPKRSMIVVPSSLKDNWCNEFEKFIPTVKYIKICTFKQYQQEATKKQDCNYIISYSLLDKIINSGPPPSTNLLIMDEAHYVKNSGSKRSKAIRKLTKHAEKFILLTGTAAQSHSDFYNLLRLVDGDMFKHFFHYDTNKKDNIFYFADRYTVPEKIFFHGGRNQYVFKKNINTAELRVISNSLVLRQRKEDVMILPPHTREFITIGKLNTMDEKYFKDELIRMETIRTVKGKLYSDVILLELIRRTGLYKVDLMIEYIQNILSTTRKFIIFTHHKNIQQLLGTFLTTRNIGHIAICGTTPMKTRTSLLQTFQDDHSCRIGLLSLGSCSTGLNLTFVNLVLFMELTFNSILYTQAECRCHRKGQVHPVTTRYMLLEGSTDDIVLRSNLSKRKCQSNLLDPRDKKRISYEVDSGSEED